MATQLVIHDNDVPIVMRALEYLQSIKQFALNSLHATDDERQDAMYTTARIEALLNDLRAPDTPKVEPNDVAVALHAGDVRLAERLRDQCYTTYPTLNRSSVDLAITNAYLDLVTGNLAPDAHLDDVGD